MWLREHLRLLKNNKVVNSGLWFCSQIEIFC